MFAETSRTRTVRRLPIGVLNSHKLRVISGFIQLVSNVCTVNIMGKRVCRHCPIPGCHSKFLIRLANHLTQVHELSEIERVVSKDEEPMDLDLVISDIQNKLCF